MLVTAESSTEAFPINVTPKEGISFIKPVAHHCSVINILTTRSLRSPSVYIYVLWVEFLYLPLNRERVLIPACKVITEEPVKGVGPEVVIDQPVLEQLRTYIPRHSLLR